MVQSTMDLDIPDFSQIVSEEFGFRRKARAKLLVKDELSGENGGEALPYVSSDILDQNEDVDYAPRSKTHRKKRAPRPRKRRVDIAEQLSDDEPLPSTDMQAYFDNTAPATDEDGNDLYCICRRGDLGKWMIGCDGCDEWYHGDCVNVAVEDEDLVDKFFCPRCQRNDEGTTKWKRKCRLKSCRKPALLAQAAPRGEDVSMAGTDEHKINATSKYCSQAHGLEYFREQVKQALITQAEVKSLILATGSLYELQNIGDVAPIIEGTLTAAEAKRSEIMAHERDALNMSIKRIETRISCLDRTQERADRINADLKARKEKEICGLDERLNLQDRDLDTLIQSAGFLDSLLTSSTDKLCTVPLKKCSRHAGWYSVKLDGYHLEEEDLRRQLTKLRLEDKEIRLAAQRRMAQ